MSFRRAKPSNYCTLSRIDRRDPNDTVWGGLKKQKLALLCVCFECAWWLFCWLRKDDCEMRQWAFESSIFVFLKKGWSYLMRPQVWEIEPSHSMESHNFFSKSTKRNRWNTLNHSLNPHKSLLDSRPLFQAIRHVCRNAHSVMKHKEPTGTWDSVFNIQNLFGYFSGYRAQKKSRVYGKLTRDLNT